MQKLKELRKKKIAIIGFGLLVITLLVGYFIIVNKRESEIVFHNDVYEYGNEIAYRDMIKEVYPEDAKITYPEDKIGEVGKYKVVFSIAKKAMEYDFSIKDTYKPTLSLKKMKRLKFMLEESLILLVILKKQWIKLMVNLMTMKLLMRRNSIIEKQI